MSARPTAEAPERAGLVLVTLILVAAVANLPWLVPAGGLLLAAALLFFGVRQWRRRDTRPPPGAGDGGLDPDDAERLRSDLARYDL